MTIIEDDPYSPLLRQTPPSFLALAPDATIHIATLAKCVSPFLRTAFIAMPDGASLEKVAQHLRSLTLMSPPLMTGLAAEWIRSGIAAEIAKRVRREARTRQMIAADILPFAASDRGFHIWIPLSTRRVTATTVEKARRRGLAVSGAGEFAVHDYAPHAIRIALGALQDRRKLSEALESLAEILPDAARSRGALV